MEIKFLDKCVECKQCLCKICLLAIGCYFATELCTTPHTKMLIHTTAGTRDCQSFCDWLMYLSGNTPEVRKKDLKELQNL